MKSIFMFSFKKLFIANGRDRLVLIMPILGLVLKMAKSKKGNKANFREWHFWKRFQSDFAVRTLLAFRIPGWRGDKWWVILQKKIHRPIITDGFSFQAQMILLTDGMAMLDKHHFDSPSNFGMSRDGRLQIVDYGNRLTRQIVCKYGDRIRKGFVENRMYTFEEYLDVYGQYIHKIPTPILQ